MCSTARLGWHCWAWSSGPCSHALVFSLFFCFGNSGNLQRTPTMWVASIMVTVCCMFTALHWNSSKVCNICRLHTLSPQQHQVPRCFHLQHCKSGYMLYPVLVLHSFLLLKYLILWLLYTLFTYLSFGRHFSPHFWAIMDNTTINIYTKFFVWLYSFNFLGYRSRFAGLWYLCVYLRTVKLFSKVCASIYIPAG